MRKLLPLALFLLCAFSPVQSPTRSPAGVVGSGSVVAIPVNLPENTSLPTVSGTPLAGEVLTCDKGSWSDALSYTYAWELNSTTISGETSTTYTVDMRDASGDVSCEVTGINDEGSTAADSAATTITYETLDKVVASALVWDLDFSSAGSYSGSGQTISNLTVSPNDSASQTDYDFHIGHSSAGSRIVDGDPYYFAESGAKVFVQNKDTLMEIKTSDGDTSAGAAAAANTDFIHSFHESSTGNVFTLGFSWYTQSSIPDYLVSANDEIDFLNTWRRCARDSVPDTGGDDGFWLGYKLGSGGYMRVVYRQNATGTGGNYDMPHAVNLDTHYSFFYGYDHDNDEVKYSWCQDGVCSTSTDTYTGYHDYTDTGVATSPLQLFGKNCDFGQWRGEDSFLPLASFATDTYMTDAQIDDIAQVQWNRHRNNGNVSAPEYVDGIEIVLDKTSEHEYLRDMGFISYGSAGDIIPTFGTNEGVAVASYVDISEDTYGTNSDFDSNDSLWAGTPWLDFGTAGDHTQHRSDGTNTPLTTFIRFSSATKAGRLRMQYGGTSVGFPDVTVYDATTDYALAFSSAPADIDDFTTYTDCLETTSRRCYEWYFYDTFTPTVLPAITGTVDVAEILTCSSGTWDTTPSSYAYQWFRDDAEIALASVSTHTLSVDDANTTLHCEVIATATGKQGAALSADQVVGNIGGAAYPTYDGFTIDFSHTNWIAMYEIEVLDDDGNDLFSGLTARNEDTGLYSGLSDDEWTTDSFYAAATTALNIIDGSPDSGTAGSGVGSIEWSSNNSSGLAVLLKFGTAKSIKTIRVALNTQTYGDMVGNLVVTEKTGDTVLTFVTEPTDESDRYQTTSNANVFWYEWTFDEDS